jgi:hypothetical protein
LQGIEKSFNNSLGKNYQFFSFLDTPSEVFWLAFRGSINLGVTTISPCSTFFITLNRILALRSPTNSLLSWLKKRQYIQFSSVITIIGMLGIVFCVIFGRAYDPKMTKSGENCYFRPQSQNLVGDLIN